MLILVMRHGEAEPKRNKENKVGDDDARHLTQSGAAQVRGVLSMARNLLPRSRIDTLISSPILRARETAGIAKEILDVTTYVEDDSLRATSTPFEVFEKLYQLKPDSTVMLVSHQPLVSSIVSSLLNWNEEYYSMSPGSIARIDVEGLPQNPTGKLVFLIPPTKALR